MNNCIHFINERGGFRVIGWYKRGVINDRGLVDGSRNTNTNNRSEVVQTDNGEIHFNIVHITPTNSEFHDPSSVLYEQMEEMKFDVSQLYRLH